MPIGGADWQLFGRFMHHALNHFERLLAENFLVARLANDIDFLFDTLPMGDFAHLILMPIGLKKGAAGFLSEAHTSFLHLVSQETRVPKSLFFTGFPKP